MCGIPIKHHFSSLDEYKLYRNEAIYLLCNAFILKYLPILLNLQHPFLYLSLSQTTF